MNTKDFKFLLKAVNEDGTFEGYLSVFDVVDLGGDLVEKGAFAKTIKEHNGEVPMLWQHDSKSPIGKLFLEEDDYGLKVKGELVLEVKQAQEAYALLKAGVIRGLSIGYETIKKAMDKGIRRLKELKLHEGSVVTFPMLPIAQITSVKSDEQKSDFLTELQQAQIRTMRGLMMNALYYSLDSIMYGFDSDMDIAAKLQASEESIDQFRSAYLEHLPKLLEMWGEKSISSEDKAGRRISSATRAQVEEAITKLQALLTDGDSTSSEEEAGKAVETEPQKDSATPGKSHLLLKSFELTPISEVQ